MKKPLVLTLAAVSLFGLSNLSAVTLSTGDVDIGIAFEGGLFDLHVHDEATDTEYEPGDVLLEAGVGALTVVPAGPEFAFLGAAGSPIWVLPQTEIPGVLFLGLGSEEIADGTFLNNEFTLRLTGLTGPGNFFLYGVDGLGNVTKYFDSTDGFGPGDSITLTTGGHEHFNWAFTAAGAYGVTLQASAQLPDFTPVLSNAVTYNFAAVPEPGVVGLLGLGLGALLLRLRRASRA